MIDRDEIVTFDGGVRRVRVASHQRLQRRGSAPPRSPRYEGRALVLVS